WFPYTERLSVEQRDVFITELSDRYIVKYPVDSKGEVHVDMIRLEVEACLEKT
ncbi:MAG: SAM-dependent methyltransferase, partial [Candidatus Electrothrix sp. AS4_5]|nr:SAM-dependent methyltransferase [Candidatus Electrothrix gigas]